MTRHAVPNNFGKFVRSLREEKNLKAKDMADLLEVSESYLYKCETRQVASLVLVKIMADKFSLKRKQERALLWAVYQDTIDEAVRKTQDASQTVQIERPSRWNKL